MKRVQSRMMDHETCTDVQKDSNACPVEGGNGMSMFAK
jgi:hypothetical protein